jgi:hypothetical protein
MALSPTATIDDARRGRQPPAAQSGNPRSAASAVSWGAIVAGAAAAASLSLILLILGTGLGLAAVSPWAYEGMSAKPFAVSTILWLSLTQLAASAIGGYLAGRLRTRWIEVHVDEVYFRDTAHGFLAWAVASLVTAALLSSATGAIVGAGLRAGAAIPGGTGAADLAKSRSDITATGYFVDALFRRNMNAAPSASAGTATAFGIGPERATASESAEVARIFMNTSRNEALPAEDIQHVGRMVSQRTGLVLQEAQKRVTDTYARAQAKAREAEIAAIETADKARKASTYAALWLFASLLMGAFVASLAATYGGRRRDA